MDVEFKGSYKSLSSFNCSGLAGLCVITGLNGSGKTQLLELFSIYKSGRNMSTNEHELEISPTVFANEIQIEGLVVEGNTVSNKDRWVKSMDRRRQQFNQSKPLLSIADAYLKKGYSVSDIPNVDIQSIFESTEELKQKLIVFFKNDKKILLSLQDNLHKAIQKITDKFRNIVDDILVWYDVARFRDKNMVDLIWEDFENVAANEKLLSVSDLFGANLDEIMYNYSKRRHDNLYQLFRKEKFNEVNNAIQDHEFVVANVSPEQILNEILTRHHIDYYVAGMDSQQFSLDRNYIFSLRKKGTEIIIPFEELSSGEKIIIGLIFRVFFYKFFSDNLFSPTLLVLDEPDSHLHPEMSKLLMDVLRETFVGDLKMTVLLTTHSPSTVALAPDESIWVMSNQPNTTLKKTTKDDALKILTQNIPTLSIDYKNHRQIFVESPLDASYYRSVYSKHHSLGKFVHELYFISYSSGKGNCDQVKKVVADLRQAGNTTTFGIIDWDANKADAEFVFVHGRDTRYSIENFILDPIYIVVFLLKNGNSSNVRSELGFDSCYVEYDIKNEDNDRLQEITNWVIQKLENRIKKEPIAGTATVHYYNDRYVKMPKWFVNYNGHQLYSLYQQVFPIMENADYKKIYNCLSTIVAKCYPLVPSETISILERIACNAVKIESIGTELLI